MLELVDRVLQQDAGALEITPAVAGAAQVAAGLDLEGEVADGGGQGQGVLAGPRGLLVAAEQLEVDAAVVEQVAEARLIIEGPGDDLGCVQMVEGGQRLTEEVVHAPDVDVDVDTSFKGRPAVGQLLQCGEGLLEAR